MTSTGIQRLLSLPAKAVRTFREAEPYRADEIFVGSDPEGKQCGSGGGTAHLVSAAWRELSSRGPDLHQWLEQQRVLVIHGCGESRRLPAYAACGKPLTPVPSLPGFQGQRPDQTLLDLQLHSYEYFFWHAPASYRLLVTCGDVLLVSNAAPPAYPQVDVLIGGLHTTAAEASHHGTMICPTSHPTQLEKFLQKPPVAVLDQLSTSHQFYLDTGLWFLSLRAIEVLMAKCGWNKAGKSFPGGIPAVYDLFGQFGPSLGKEPSSPDSQVSALTAAVLPIPDARFYHFGTNRTLLESVTRLRRQGLDTNVPPSSGSPAPPRMQPVVLHSKAPQISGRVHDMVWVENSHVPASWTLSERHVITGVPENNWTLTLEPGQCLDIIPIEGNRVCIRPYGFNDDNRGQITHAGTGWMEQQLPAWLKARGISMEQAGLDARCDVFDAPLFPVIERNALTEQLVVWMLAPDPCNDDRCRQAWLASKRLSGHDILGQADIVSQAGNRRQQLKAELSVEGGNRWLDTTRGLDLAATARLSVGEQWPVPEPAAAVGAADNLPLVHDDMFRFRIAGLRKHAGAEAHAKNAFRRLRDSIVGRIAESPVRPRRSVLDDQIVWGRAPIRLDLAGGWTDTPPYCLEQGGSVTNVAVNLNSQPPIQVFGRFTTKPEIVLRSIDLGVDQRVHTYDELRQYATLGDGFGIAKAALALAGLEQRFHAGHEFSSLEQQLQQELGGGLEISMVCAIPKGSGLGTSSILAATLLGLLSDMMGLNWTLDDLFSRTMALEQMLTSGGGWQDQVGGISGGIKLIATRPGMVQQPVLRWLPDTLFRDGCANRMLQLYYTGLTRIAHDILGEIVRAIFLNSGEHLAVLRAIGHNALFAADAIQRNDWPCMREAVRRSWELNQRMDSGTNPPQVLSILSTIGRWDPACKLLGAGGGGYLLILAPDPDAGRSIRSALNANPPNARARFVDMEVSRNGLEVTRS